MGAISWSLVFTLAWLALAEFLLSGCAQPPRDLQAIHSAILARVPYRYDTGRDLTYVPTDRVEAGNCAKQAFTSYIDRRHAGYRDAQIVLCRNTGGRAMLIRLSTAGYWMVDLSGFCRRRKRIAAERNWRYLTVNAGR
jgi:hypothetical protein